MRDARIAAREVYDEGAKLSENLNALSTSLRRNAERLLGDVREAHDALTSGLEKHGGKDERQGAEGDLDVPQFVPPR